jgi:ABC-type Fe3+/spermidine/putrescine transport system ATPase subunit
MRSRAGASTPETVERSPAAATEPPFVELRGLSKRYGQVAAVQDVSLAIRRGEFFCLLGPSGCGKTTTLRLMAGFLTPDAGDVVVAGDLVTGLPSRRRNMGVVFQDYALFPHMTLWENVAYGLKTRKAHKDRVRRRVAELLSLVRLEHLADRLPSQLSGGEQQRGAVARALAIEPTVLLLDEPLSNLDARLRADMQHEIPRVHRETGVTTLMVTHDQDEAFGLADRVGLMRSGHVEQIGSPRELYRSPRNTFVAQFIGKANLLRGRLLSEDPAEIEIEGARVEARTATTGRTGEPAVLVVRPEALAVAREGDPSLPCLRGTVADVTYHGAYIRVRVTTAAHELEARGAPDEPPAVGDAVCVTWRESDGVIVADETGSGA